ncbi:AAA family ATPase [Ensifer adhaerens]|uniref:AAA family ATPase n=1 Tax=Ensifer adhaerens TaxID=106592 RepID=UPI00132EB66F|nr:DUF3696 domain-containing protein [Ensifer adhaerens]QHG74436.1 DUF3696 domain-containing protein [Ensifer adhaerens]
MITELETVGFKRFIAQRLSLAPLTILAGLNGSGKTSMVQALLLTAEAGRSRVESIRLNGPFGLELGTADDVLNWESSFPFRVTVRSGDSVPTTWEFFANKPDQLHLDFTLTGNKPTYLNHSPRSFTYLSAERLGPRGSASSSSLPDDDLEIGVRGEYSAQVLSVLGDALIKHPDRQHPLSPEKTPRLLKYEIEQWLSEILRPIEISAERLGTSPLFELRFRCSDSDWVAAPNMGFGASYVLPIVLAGLTADVGGLLIVENPEAHLHPAGQSRIGVFLAWLASKGVQVLIETHSDHVLNGIRRAIGEFRYLLAEDAIVHYFPTEKIHEKSVETLKFMDAGGVSHWPPGFFDQYQIDVGSLGRVRRKRT